ncbi:hypothetical protein TUZN_1042 [Thermoproteus uzoniensis 768-20]|uniref:Thioredoxin domain-containing protein n=1 Tax=Thermoproteus uzoniensis (strain 768-20) TaxID=999630 RepID=F2L6C7_THEU7|nr:thioredoxin domain-containing protein [Thermoproteus uzoniensis]AEA12523.1 hypothetical protein TUZN_1042 [Thermoproteus uzoniensis 768-20]
MEELRLRCLQSSGSPFVLEGLNSKIRWWGWCREAFEIARREDKPVLVDVGAVWCHWCHVMDATTYSDDAVAEMVNREFVAIKVDRDERPDVDRRLQEAAQLISGQSGWPLTVFMTPEGRVIWAATYLPPRRQMGLPGMDEVLEAVVKAYRERRGEIERLHADIAAELSSWHSPSAGEPRRDAQLDVLAALAASFDEEFGGFGGAPKFPPITQLELLLTRHFYDGVGIYGKMAERTLDAMALGGVYDQLLGGFFRYSTDRLWLIPHYEKLLVDNAELLALYAKAYRHFGKRLYRKVAEGIVKWLDEFMRAPGGGYYASQDADVEGEEGGYYRWSLEELRSILGGRYGVAARHFGLEDFDWPEGKATLRVAVPMEGPEVEEVYRILLEARRRRKPPFVDKTIYVGWSCAMAYAELLSARLAGVGDRRHALDTLELIARRYGSDGALPRGYRGGSPIGVPTVEDYAYCALALVEGFSQTGDLRLVEAADKLGGDLASKFLDAGGFKDVEKADDVVGIPNYPFLDTPNFSGNSLAAISLALLSEITGRREYRDAAYGAVSALYGKMERVGPSASGMWIALDLLAVPPPRTVVVGDSPELWRAALEAYRPWHVVVPVVEGWPFPESSIRAMARGPKPAAYVCAGTACSMPIRDPDELRRAVEAFAKDAYALK